MCDPREHAKVVQSYKITLAFKQNLSEQRTTAISAVEDDRETTNSKVQNVLI